MATIDIQALIKAMLSSTENILAQLAPEVKEYAASEFGKIAASIAFISQQVIAKKMTPEQAALHLDLQKNASRTVLLTIEGMGLMAVQRILNAALDSIKLVVNKAVGFDLIA